jgi:hypothetical protein
LQRHLPAGQAQGEKFFEEKLLKVVFALSTLIFFFDVQKLLIVQYR